MAKINIFQLLSYVTNQKSLNNNKTNKLNVKINTAKKYIFITYSLTQTASLAQYLNHLPTC